MSAEIRITVLVENTINTRRRRQTPGRPVTTKPVQSGFCSHRDNEAESPKRVRLLPAGYHFIVGNSVTNFSFFG